MNDNKLVNLNDLKIINVNSLKPLKEEIGFLQRRIEYNIDHSIPECIRISDEQIFESIRLILDLIEEI